MPMYIERNIKRSTFHTPTFTIMPPPTPSTTTHHSPPPPPPPHRHHHRHHLPPLPPPPPTTTTTTKTLSDHIWKLKKVNTDFNIKCDIIKNVKPYAPGEKRCKLCLQEKISILISKPSLNKRTEIFGHCVHRKQFLLNNIKEQYTPPASQQQRRKYSTNQQLSRLKQEPKGAS